MSCGRGSVLHSDKTSFVSPVLNLVRKQDKKRPGDGRFGKSSWLECDWGQKMAKYQLCVGGTTP